MAKIVDITEKLDFESEYVLQIRDTRLMVDGDAETAVKLLGLVSADSSPKAMVEAADLLFPEESRKRLSGLHLSFKDFSTAIESAADLIFGADEDSVGEGETRTMT